MTQKIHMYKTSSTLDRFLGVKSVAIIGYESEGKAAEKYIKKRYPKIKIGILDVKRDKNYLKKQSRYDLAVKTPGLPKEKITIPYVTTTNIFFSEVSNKVIGITGSKGKSTTASLLYDMLHAGHKNVTLIGNIGTPALTVLDRKIQKNEIFIFELSSYMLDDIEYSPHVSVLLNLYQAHLDYHQTIKRYYQAKMNIFKYQKKGDIGLTYPFKKNINILKGDNPLEGRHNLENIYAAVAVAKYFKVSDANIKKAIKNFKPLPYRLENVGMHKGITFYDDSISTTPESTIEALHALTNVDTIFLGGSDEGFQYKELERTLRIKKVRNIVLFPDTGKRILKSLKGFTVLKTRSMRKAVTFAFKHTKPGSICLLSTASPSFSVWKDYKEKGDQFQKYIKEL